MCNVKKGENKCCRDDKGDDKQICRRTVEGKNLDGEIGKLSKYFMIPPTYHEHWSNQKIWLGHIGGGKVNRIQFRMIYDVYDDTDHTYGVDDLDDADGADADDVDGVVDFPPSPLQH